MARLQILQLPEGASDERPPFALVIDQIGSAEAAEQVRNDLLTAAEHRAIVDLGRPAVLTFADTINIPANEVATQAEAPSRLGELAVRDEIRRLTDERDELHAELGLASGQLHSAALSAIRGKHANIRELIERAERAEAERDEARQWARHGYEIGQKNCGWTDHGVAPAWLTEGWPRSFDSCEHLQRASEYDTALARVRSLPEQPEMMNSQHPDPSGYLHGYRVAIGVAKRAARQPEPAIKPDDRGHLFNEPGFVDPVRCARCGVDGMRWQLSADRQPCTGPGPEESTEEVKP
jgi:hypothetical protein